MVKKLIKVLQIHKKKINYQISNYDQMIKEMVELMKNNNLYKQYNIG